MRVRAAGNDTLVGGTGNDTITTTFANLQANVTLDGGEETDTFTLMARLLSYLLGQQGSRGAKRTRGQGDKTPVVLLMAYPGVSLFSTTLKPQLCSSHLGS